MRAGGRFCTGLDVRKCRPAFRLTVTGNGRPLTRPFSNKGAKGRPSRSAFVRGPASGGTIIAGPAAEFPSPLERRPSPTVSPPGPASGPRDGGNGRKYGARRGEGDKYLAGCEIRWRSSRLVQSSCGDDHIVAVTRYGTWGNIVPYSSRLSRSTRPSRICRCSICLGPQTCDCRKWPVRRRASAMSWGPALPRLVRKLGSGRRRSR